VVVVNTPLIRPGHGPAPWPYRDGVSRGGDRPPVPGYGQHREPEPRRSEPLPRPRHEFDARQFDRRPVEPRETDRRNGRPGDSAPGFERRGPYGGTVVATPPRAPVTAPPAAAAPAVAITPQPARTPPMAQPVATVPGSAAPPRPAAPVAAPPATDAAAVTPAPAQPDRRDARRTYGEGFGPYGRKPYMQQP